MLSHFTPVTQHPSAALLALLMLLQADLDESCIESGQHMDTADYRELHALRLQHYPDSAAAAAAEDPMDMAGALAAAAAAGVMAVVAPVVMAQ